MKRMTRWMALCCVGASVMQFGNCTQNLGQGARDGALSAWKTFITQTVGAWLDQADLIPQEG